MPEFKSAIDIGSRACQHCGVGLLDPVRGFTDGALRHKSVLRPTIGMQNRIRAALLAAFLSLLTAIPVAAQQFPQSLPANSVVCRLGVGPGPAQACSFERLRTALGFVTGVGTVTSVGCGAGLSGGTITGAGSCAVVFGTTAGTVMQGNDVRVTGALQNANNLSDLGNAALARAALSLGSLSLQNHNNVTITGGAVSGTTITGAALSGGTITGAGQSGGTVSGAALSGNTITGGTITGLPTCAAASEACPKSYIDAIAAGFRTLPAVRLATAAVLPNTPTYSNGTAGVGATLTAGANAALVVDGTNAVAGDSILVKDQASTFQNGVYTVTTVGDGSTAWVLTRRTDFDTAAEMLSGTIVTATVGATNLGNTYNLQTTVATVGTTAAVFNLLFVQPQQWTTVGADVSRATGKVGIGTASPSNALVVGSDAIGATGSPSNSIAVGNASGNSSITTGQSATARLYNIWRYNATEASSYGEIATVAGLPLALQPFGGNVGIGTSTPASKLDVAGSIYTAPALGYGVRAANVELGNYANRGADNAVGVFGGNLIFQSGAANFTGNVGIGTTSPSAKLHTSGSVRFSNFGAGLANFDASGNVSSKPGYTTSVIYAADYGCLPANSAATNNTNCQAAIDAVTTNGGGILQLGAGNYNVSTTLTCNRQITIRGVGIASIGVGVGTADGTKITMAVNADVFSCVTWDSVQFRDMSIRMPDGGTRAGISVTAPDLTITSSSRGVRIENVNFLAGGYGVYLKAAANFAITNNFMVNQSISGIVVDESVNTVTQDIGDATITGNVIWDLNGTATGHGIHLNPSAIMVHNNKILGWTNSIFLNVAGLTGTLLISSNSLEEFRVNAFRVTHDGNASHVYGYINFSNNQVQVSAGGTYQGAVAIIIGTVQYLKDIIIGNNIITLNGTSYAPAVGISIQDGRYVNVHDNILDMGSTASSIALNASGHATNVQFLNNQTRNYVTKYLFSVATLLHDLSGMTVAEAAGLVLANGSQVYFTDGNPGTKPCTGSSSGAMAFAQGGFKCLAN